MNKKRKIIHTGYETLHNKQEYLQGISIKPPTKDYNGDKSVFYDTLQITPVQDPRVPIFQIGSVKEEVQVEIIQRA